MRRENLNVFNYLTKASLLSNKKSESDSEYIKNIWICNDSTNRAMDK